MRSVCCNAQVKMISGGDFECALCNKTLTLSEVDLVNDPVILKPKLPEELRGKTAQMAEAMLGAFIAFVLMRQARAVSEAIRMGEVTAEESMDTMKELKLYLLKAKEDFISEFDKV